MPYYVVEVPVEGRSGRIWASRLPGNRPGTAEGEIEALWAHGIRRVVCLVPIASLQGLHGAEAYVRLARERWGEAFHGIDIPDHQIPPDDEDFEHVLALVDAALARGEHVLVHCLGGCGRSGMFTACLMVRAGYAPRDAIVAFRMRRRCGPETADQVAYVFRYEERWRAATLARPTLPPDAVVELRWSRRQGSTVPIARGGLATVYAGRVRFRTGGTRRVAIKTFRRPIGDAGALATQQCIDALRNAGVNLPRMFLHRTSSGEWVQVSPMFGSITRGSKFSQPANFYRDLTLDHRAFMADQLARVASAGYTPSIDLFVAFRDRSRGVFPVDLDLVVPEPEPARRANLLMNAIVRLGTNALERDAIYAAALAAVTSPVREALVALREHENSPFRALWAME